AVLTIAATTIDDDRRRRARTEFPTSNPTAEPTSHPTGSPTRAPLAAAPGAYDETHDADGACPSPTQTLLRIEVLTDEYPRDTSWKFVDRSRDWIVSASPRGGYEADETRKHGRSTPVKDVRDVCLDEFADETIAATDAEYEFVLEDAYGDGLCCRTNVAKGHYKILERSDDGVGTDETRGRWKVLASGSDFKTKEVRHRFRLREGSSAPPPLEQSELVDPDAAAELAASSTRMELLCPPPKRKITVQIKTDSYGADTSWTLRSVVGSADDLVDGSVLARNETVYASLRIDERSACVDDASLYRLTIEDVYGDGMCCRYGGGWYKVLVGEGGEREAIVHGGSFGAERVTHLLNTTKPALTERDEMYLHSHNKRRRYWHERYNATYIPLLWSESLKADAQAWADELLEHCGDGMRHDPRTAYGENAAGNTGGGSWGARKGPETILHRFVDREVGLSWPANGHLTQALWRASKYVGCAEGHKKFDFGNNRQCHTQVCRYARVGNCDMASFKGDDGVVDWQTAMLQDVSVDILGG
ncbi:hypothetical protein ACHAWF_005399, partial [Thalassiosira exigua]